ncbi:MAG: Glu/Leu/Phe/Val dehydrogenase [Phycisphaerales bacterium]|nr:Glu/Leu/Phe/Val dehydrogenase [Phycisphaerales bacterium]
MSHSSQSMVESPSMEKDLTLADSPAYRRNIENFDNAAKVLNLDSNIARRLRQPERILIVSVPVRMDDGTVNVYTGYRVQHNDSLGPYKGGIRFHEEVDLGEVSALAMSMTWTCAVMGLPLGGGKGAVKVDPFRLSRRELQNLTRRYTAEILPIIGPNTDVPAPDMGTNEQTMAWIVDTFSQRLGHFAPAIVTGKPVEVGGSVLRSEATGRGVVYTIEEAANEIGLNLKGATYVLHGFGNVGTFAAQEMTKRGAKLIAVADVSGGYVNKSGFDVHQLFEHVRRNRTLEGIAAERVPALDVLTVPCDVLIPAATGHVIDSNNAPKIKCKIMAEGANGPTMPEADVILERNGVFTIPDIVCNAGGVTVSYFEWVQGGMHFFWNEEEIDTRLQAIIRKGYRGARAFAKDHNVPTRIAALCVGISRVDKAMRLRGLYA